MKEYTIVIGNIDIEKELKVKAEDNIEAIKIALEEADEDVEYIEILYRVYRDIY